MSLHPRSPVASSRVLTQPLRPEASVTLAGHAKISCCSLSFGLSGRGDVKPTAPCRAFSQELCWLIVPTEFGTPNGGSLVGSKFDARLSIELTTLHSESALDLPGFTSAQVPHCFLVKLQFANFNPALFCALFLRYHVAQMIQTIYTSLRSV